MLVPRGGSAFVTRFRAGLDIERARGCEVAENQSDTLGHFGAPPQNEREFAAAPGNRARVEREGGIVCSEGNEYACKRL